MNKVTVVIKEVNGFESSNPTNGTGQTINKKRAPSLSWRRIATEGSRGHWQKQLMKLSSIWQLSMETY